MERGSLRSGTRFAARNLNYYPTVRELLQHHQRLLSHEPAVTTRAARIAGLNFGSLLQTTIGFHFNSTIIRSTLRAVFFNLFREHTPRADIGFEVVVTFNAILVSTSERTTYSLFYGHKHRADNLSGAAPELKYRSPTVVRGHKSKLSKNNFQLIQYCLALPEERTQSLSCGKVYWLCQDEAESSLGTQGR